MIKIVESKYNLKNSKVNNISIVHISDIHYDIKYNIKRLDLIVKYISQKKPNYVCITGDILDNNGVLNNENSYKIIYDFFEKIASISKVILTLGNHEMGKITKDIDIKDCYLKIIAKLKKIPNIVLLDNEIYEDNDICFVGFNPSYNYYEKIDYHIFNDDYDKLNIKLDNKYNILLIHTPKDLLEDNIYNNRFNKFDLILAGHTHGGLMPVNFYGHMGIISPGKRLFPKNVRGHLIRNKTHLIICSGVVRLSNSAGFLHYFNFIYKIHINNILITKGL